MPDRVLSQRARRRRGVLSALVLMLLVAGAVVGAAVAFTAAQTPLWTSRTTVVVDIEETGVTRAPAMGTEREIATSTVVARAAARALGADAEQLLRRLRITVPVETNVLQIEYDDVTAARAQAGAAAFANAYVDYRSSPRVSGPRSTAPSASVISPADLPAAPSKPNWPLNLGTAAVLGTALGVAAGYRRFAASLDHRAEDRPLDAALELLAVLPARRAGGIASEAPRSVQEEQAYQRLCAHVLEHASSFPVPAVLVVGARGTVTTSAVAWQLAADLAQGGAPTVLIAAATDLGSIHRMTGGSSSCGLVGAVASPRQTQTALLPTGVSGLSVMPPGAVLGSGEVLKRHGVRTVLRQLSRSADFVVVDGGSVLGAGVGLELVADVPTALLVVGPDTGPGEVEEAAAALRRRDGRVLGTVLALPRSRRERRSVERRVRDQAEPPPLPDPLAGSSLPTSLNGG